MTAPHQLIDAIDALLPQTQCTKCGFEGCRPYAAAIATNEASINRCPPGDIAGIKALSELLNTPVLPLDTERGQPGPLTVAFIHEEHCIGCTLCIQACPVDAIVGANKRMHTVLTDWCTGCDLCLAPCPVDCIEMRPAQRTWTSNDATTARSRHQQHLERAQERAKHQTQVRAEQAAPTAEADKQATILQALARARAKRQVR